MPAKFEFLSPTKLIFQRASTSYRVTNVTYIQKKWKKIMTKRFIEPAFVPAKYHATQYVWRLIEIWPTNLTVSTVWELIGRYSGQTLYDVYSDS